MSTADIDLLVTGRGRYVDDLPAPQGLLHGVLVTSPVARGTIRSLDLEASQNAPGIHQILTVDDIPGDPHIGPIVQDEPLLAKHQVHCVGQAIALVLGESRDACLHAAGLAKIDFDPEEPILTIAEAIEAGSFLTTPHCITRGNIDRAFDDAALIVEGVVASGAQDHFYLETQCALACPHDDGRIHVWSSTQHPTEIQKMVARVCGVPASKVVCEVPRLGGGFGGKESQATPYGVLAALAAQRTGRPVKIRLDRGQDMATTGRRHPFWSRYRAGFSEQGAIVAIDARVYSDGGWSADLSSPVMDRALFHLDNAYFVPNLRFEGRVCRTNLPSNTAFRGFGGPQGMLVIEDALDQAASRLGLSQHEIRQHNYYGAAPRNIAPYGQVVPDPRIVDLHGQIMESSEVARRRQEITHFNTNHRWSKRGLALQPVKFGISFTNSLLNQAGALVLIYADGTVQLNHGGTEMGQGLHHKMRAVCAEVLGIPNSAIHHMPTATDKVPNTSPTAASSGSDLNGQAVRKACETLRQRLHQAARTHWGLPNDEPITMTDGTVLGGSNTMSFAELARACWLQGVSLSATGHYKTPGITYDRDRGEGTPFFYYAYGVAVVEVEVQGLTGEHRLRRVDIVHDVGRSLAQDIDQGQIEGGFVQGLGWLTGEEVVLDQGRCLTVGPSTYKIPTVGDIPRDFRVTLMQVDQPHTIFGSKAVGEPPFMLAIGVIGALKEAIAGFRSGRIQLGIPATPENILRAIQGVTS